jgi:hypothetical protein
MFSLARGLASETLQRGKYLVNVTPRHLRAIRAVRAVKQTNQSTYTLSLLCSLPGAMQS